MARKSSKKSSNKFIDKFDFFSTPKKRKKASKGFKSYLTTTKSKMRKGM